MVNRKVMISILENGGHTKKPWREKSLGELGQYGERVRFFRLGRVLNACIRVRVTSPVYMRHMGAVADMDVGE